MSIVGPGTIAQARLRPIRTATTNAGANGNGGGINYGMGRGSVRIAGITYSIADSSEAFSMIGQIFVARIVVVNGDYPNSSLALSPFADLSDYDLLFDITIQDAGPRFLPLWPSGIVTDDGLNATAMISQLFWPTGAPAGIIPQSTLQLHGDHFQPQDLSFSPGSIFQP